VFRAMLIGSQSAAQSGEKHVVASNRSELMEANPAVGIRQWSEKCVRLSIILFCRKLQRFL
jgi:hypothetical protein